MSPVAVADMLTRLYASMTADEKVMMLLTRLYASMTADQKVMMLLTGATH